MQKLLNDLQMLIDGIDPIKFFWIYIGIWAVLLLLGYVLAGGFYVFLMVIFIFMNALVVYQYRNPPIKTNKYLFLTPLFGLVYSGIFHSQLLFAPKIISDKSQASMITGIVPESHEYIQGSGRGAKSYYYLNIDGHRFHCDDDNHDDCKNIYAYKGQMATVWYHENIAYEIEVNGQKIYEFHAQHQKLKNTQNERKSQLIWAFILFGVPSLLFHFVNIRIIRDIPVIDEDKLIEIANNKSMLEKFKKTQFKSRVGLTGQSWRILFGIFGTLLLFASIMFFFMEMMGGAILLFIMMVVCYYVASLPYKNAKAEVSEYYGAILSYDDLPDDDLSDYELSGFYHYMGLISWVLMVVFLSIIFIDMIIIVMSFYKGFISLTVVGIILLVILLALMGVIIKRAINKRDWVLGS